ncbi:MAG: asparagine synthase (glutamine-hydrolyzing) [Hyphomicrobiales bacterium]|nr:asparagine synthase (glutamine-hydrolyzing) [Hyphomicrobiales bacterium]
MCGIAGLYQRQPTPDIEARFVDLALHHLARRGPDASRTWSGDRTTLVHTRLSIIDVAGGAQPMEDDDGIIVFNGEIYNFAEVRDRTYNYRSRSDTEVLLHGLAREGIAFLDRLDGMFAFGWLDKRRRKLVLARDRFGIKPLYYVHGRDRFAFASTMHPLMLFSRKTINQDAFVEYYLLRGARGEHTLFDDVHELKAGSCAVFDLATGTLEVRPWKHSSADDVTSRGGSPRNEAALLEELDQTLHLAVRRHLVSDVPVATLLSGGVDSSLITAIAAEYSPDLAAFSIGFQDRRFDESPYAQALARRYGLRHFVKFCDESDFLASLEGWPAAVDDPVADPSALMVYQVSQFARDCGFKVVLTGEGADELFGGYNQYFRFQLARRLNAVGRAVPFVADLAAMLLPHRTRHVHFLRQIAKAPVFHGSSMIFEPHLAPEVFSREIPVYPTVQTLRGALALDQQQRLADDLLCIRDRATMHASIEARVPFVTRYVADFAASLDEGMLIRGRAQKYLLRRLARRYVPPECLDRPKVGFDLPLAAWFRGRLRELVLDTVASTWQREFFRAGAIEKVVDWHMSGRANFADKIWAFVLLDRNVRSMRAIA